MKLLTVCLSLTWVLCLPVLAWPLTVALDDRTPPFCSRDDDGQAQGILVDIWNLWSKKSGQPVTVLALPRDQALAAFQEGRADVLDGAFTGVPGYSSWLRLPVYTTVASAAYVRDRLTGVRGPRDLGGYVVGIREGDRSLEALRAQGLSGLKAFPHDQAVIEGAVRGEIHAFIMDIPTAQHYLSGSQGLQGFHQAFILGGSDMVRAVPPGRNDLMAQVLSGLARMTPSEIQGIQERWQGQRPPATLEAPGIPWAWAAGLAVLVLLILVIVFLRVQVRVRTGLLAGTERKLRASEQRNQAVVAALPDLLFVLDRAGTIEECRAPSPSELYQDPERFVGQPLSRFVPPEVAAEVAARMDEADQLGGLAVLERSLEIRGRNRTFEGRIARMEDGKYLAIVRDITSVRRAWEDDLHRNKLESLGVLAGGLAHDFNNSLAVIQGFVSLARLQLSQPEKALMSLDKAVGAARRAAGLTSQLRVLAKGGAMTRRALSVRDLAEEAAHLVLSGTPSVLAVEAAGGPWTVEGDLDQLSQVFHNLVLNAVQAMPQGGRVTLVFRRTPEGRVAVSVADQGQGIEAEVLPRIFDPYFTTRPKASGLGLSVVHAVVEAHGGSLEVESSPGGGTMVTVYLPESKAVPEILRPLAVSADGSLGGLAVLIMEDEDDLRDLTSEVCRSLGLVPTACRTGTEALEAFDQAASGGHPFPLVLSDLLVPGAMGGREMITKMRTRGQNFRALAFTGFSTERSAEDFHNGGFDVIMAKPFTVDELKARIVELMKSPWKNPAKNT